MGDREVAAARAEGARGVQAATLPARFCGGAHVPSCACHTPSRGITCHHTWHHVPSYVSSCGCHMSSCVSSRVIRPAEVRRQARTLVDLGPWLVTKHHCRLRGRSGGFTPFGARGRLCTWGQGSRQKPPYLPLDFVVNRKLREKSKVFRNKPSWAPQPGALPRALRLRLPPDEPELTPLLLNH